MEKKWYIFWDEGTKPPTVSLFHDTWDSIKHISRTGCKAFKKWDAAAMFADELQQGYMDADLAKKAGPINDDEAYLQSLVDSGF